MDYCAFAQMKISKIKPTLWWSWFYGGRLEGRPTASEGGTNVNEGPPPIGGPPPIFSGGIFQLSYMMSELLF